VKRRLNAANLFGRIFIQNKRKYLQWARIGQLDNSAMRKVLWTNESKFEILGVQEAYIGRLSLIFEVISDAFR
jgi:hypothetical protein